MSKMVVRLIAPRRILKGHQDIKLLEVMKMWSRPKMSFLKGFWGFMIIPPVENYQKNKETEVKRPQKVPNSEILDDFR